MLFYDSGIISMLDRKVLVGHISSYMDKIFYLVIETLYFNEKESLLQNTSAYAMSQLANKSKTVYQFISERSGQITFNNIVCVLTFK